ncbi:MAG TPA: Cof-type HAD-IIB family hydrolase [Spirochaetales bacterium]|nr:Cof-type HAD-IIB family hydrolase [Spirochaetales bacterium]HRY54890.1 Cof-type HAD-IIB family hydrolase [Spirochaetia bacterium]HRZ66110.1 Cof-type HAD-IIB family hydrolase [Spirochaetia bacterium]
MPVELIALDLDDTLLRTDLTVSEANRAALAEARAAGIRVVLASGRNIHSMRHYARLLELEGPEDYLICSNGAEIIESATGRILDERRLAPELCAEAARAIEERGFPWQIYEEGLIHVNRPNPWALEDSKLTGQPAILLEDEEALFARGLIKFVVPGEPERIEGLRRELSALFAGRAAVLTSKPYFLEVLALGVDKGEALGRLSASLGIPMERVMAVGDAMNDLGMVRAAGHGSAPANAIPAVKAAARHVASRTNDEDAVAELVRGVALAGRRG